MAARGRGSAAQRFAVVAAAFAVACCCIAGCGVGAATYYVGDGNGWSLSSASWPNGKQFHAGDVLGTKRANLEHPVVHSCCTESLTVCSVLRPRAVFRYMTWMHNVVAVGEDGYNGCTTPAGSRTYTSGSDSVTLARGDNRFICTRYGHCYLGMKMVVNAV
jgi:hypothetical protein